MSWSHLGIGPRADPCPPAWFSLNLHEWRWRWLRGVSKIQSLLATFAMESLAAPYFQVINIVKIVDSLAQFDGVKLTFPAWYELSKLWGLVDHSRLLWLAEAGPSVALAWWPCTNGCSRHAAAIALAFLLALELRTCFLILSFFGRALYFSPRALSTETSVSTCDKAVSACTRASSEPQFHNSAPQHLAVIVFENYMARYGQPPSHNRGSFLFLVPLMHYTFKTVFAP